MGKIWLGLTTHLLLPVIFKLVFLFFSFQLLSRKTLESLGLRREAHENLCS